MDPTLGPRPVRATANAPSATATATRTAATIFPRLLGGEGRYAGARTREAVEEESPLDRFGKEAEEGLDVLDPGSRFEGGFIGGRESRPA